MASQKAHIVGWSRRTEIDLGGSREIGGGGHAVAAAASVKGGSERGPGTTQRPPHTAIPSRLLAQDVMTQPVKSIAADATVSEAERTMTKYGVNVLSLLDKQERYAGIISREIVQKALFHRLGVSRSWTSPEATSTCPSGHAFS